MVVHRGLYAQRCGRSNLIQIHSRLTACVQYAPLSATLESNSLFQVAQHYRSVGCKGLVGLEIFEPATQRLGQLVGF